MAVYTSETSPLSQTYDERGLLRKVDGTGDADEVFARLEQALPTATA